MWYLDMDSVISKAGLDALLASMQNSIPISKVTQALTRASKFNPVEKNELYHSILLIIKNNDAKEAALLVSQEIQSLLEDRITLAMSDVDGTLVESSDNKIKGPIFYRVG